MALPKPVQYITNEEGCKQSVVLPVETYEELLEDINDLVAIVERKDDSLLSIEEVISNLEIDGIL